jgi:hypothetical protein
MPTMTIADLIAEIRKPGKIEMPVPTATDVVHLVVEKSDLLRALAEYEPTDTAPWCFYGESDGVRRLDIDHE